MTIFGCGWMEMKRMRITIGPLEQAVNFQHPTGTKQHPPFPSGWSTPGFEVAGVGKNQFIWHKDDAECKRLILIYDFP